MLEHWLCKLHFIRQFGAQMISSFFLSLSAQIPLSSWNVVLKCVYSLSRIQNKPLWWFQMNLFLMFFVFVILRFGWCDSPFSWYGKWFRWIMFTLAICTQFCHCHWITLLSNKTKIIAPKDYFIACIISVGRPSSSIRWNRLLSVTHLSNRNHFSWVSLFHSIEWNWTSERMSQSARKIAFQANRTAL